MAKHQPDGTMTPDGPVFNERGCVYTFSVDIYIPLPGRQGPVTDEEKAAGELRARELLNGAKAPRDGEEIDGDLVGSKATGSQEYIDPEDWADELISRAEREHAEDERARRALLVHRLVEVETDLEAPRDWRDAVIHTLLDYLYPRPA